MKSLIEFLIKESLNNFKRGDIIEVPGADNTKHKAVMLSDKSAVYLDDEGSVESVPEKSIKSASKAKRTTTIEKKLAAEYLKNMKEDLGEGYKVHAISKDGEKFKSGIHDTKKSAQDQHYKMAKSGIYKKIDVQKEEVELEESSHNNDRHDNLNDLIFDFQKKIMGYGRSNLDEKIAKKLKSIDNDLDDLRSDLFKIRKGK